MLSEHEQNNKRPLIVFSDITEQYGMLTYTFIEKGYEYYIGFKRMYKHEWGT